MVTGGQQAEIGESHHDELVPHPLDQFVPDPTGKRPLCGEEQFSRILEGMVADNAPRLFAIVQEYGDRVDARIAAWGIAFGHRADIIDTDGSLHMGLQEPEDALPGFHFGTHILPRLVWFNPDAATPDEDEKNDID